MYEADNIENPPSSSESITSVSAWLDSVAKDATALIKIGNEANANLTQAEIAAGLRGSQPPLAASSGNPAAANAAPYPTVAGVKMSLPVIVGVGLLIYFLSTRR